MMILLVLNVLINLQIVNNVIKIYVLNVIMVKYLYISLYI